MIYKLYYINLEKRLDKKVRTEKEILKAQVPKFRRFNAIDGPSYKTLESLVKEHQHINFNPSVFSWERVINSNRYKAKLACWLSHYTILKAHENLNSNKWIIILEDDVILNYSWEQLQEYFKLTLNKNPDIIILGDRIGISDVGDQIQRYRKNTNYGCDCYAVKINSIKKFIHFLRLDQKNNKCSIDNKLSELDNIKIVPLQGPAFGFCIDREQKDSDIEII